MKLGSHWLRDLRNFTCIFGHRCPPCLSARWQPVAVLTGIAMAFALLVASSVLKFNLTESMPIGFYLLRRTTSAHVGDIVIACPPQAAQRVGITNGYLARSYGILPDSRCASGSAPVLKYIIALAGDELQIDGRGLSLNGRLISRRHQAVVDRRGQRLVDLTNGRLRLRKGELWLYSPEQYSWDSRYFGPIKQSDVLGIAKAIWTTKGVLRFSRSSLVGNPKLLLQEVGGSSVVDLAHHLLDSEDTLPSFRMIDVNKKFPIYSHYVLREIFVVKVLLQVRAFERLI